ncbi:MAG: response regulator [Planctomycetes bacterium]|nr:response regulator [Planctomycetota bacterium]
MPGRPSAEALYLVVEDSPDAILELSPDGRVLSANPAAVAIFKREVSALLSLRDTDLYADPAVREEVLGDCRRVGRSRDREVRIRADGGEERVVSLSARSVEAGEGRVRLLLTLRDLTHQREIQSRVAQQERMASVGLLAAGVAHEFNNIMATIYGFAQLASVKEKYRDELVRTVLEYSRRAKDITESLLSFSKQKPQVFELADPVKVLEDVLSLISKELEKDSIQVVRRYADVPPTLINVGKLEEVYLNLLINARQAIVRDGTITIDVDREGTNIRLRFADTGCGIPRENLERIFEPFFTTKGAFGGGEQPGTGLGLSVSYNIVQEHRGELTVHSEVGVGTTMTLRLPIRQERRQRELEPPEGEERRSAILASRQCSILLVDDEVAVLDLLAGMLEPHALTSARTGCEAVERYRTGRHDYVILDLVMPGDMDGFQAFDAIKALDPEARLIILTGRAEDERLRGYAKRAAGYLRKPFGLKDLSRLIV